MKLTSKRKPTFSPAIITPNLSVPFRERAVLVKFHERCWATTRQNHTITDDVLKANGATKDAGAFYERLVSKSALAPSKEARQNAYTYHVTYTAPWMDEGSRVLPVGLLKEYLDKMRGFEATAKQADAEFLVKLDDHIEAAKTMRGKMFNNKDYPTKEELARKFAFDVHVMPMPDVQDWRIRDLNAKDFAAIREEAEGHLVSLQQNIVADLYERLLTVVTRMRDKLKEDDPIFRNSLVGNIKEMVVLVGKLNVTGDPKLEEMRNLIKRKLVKQSPDELREAPELRKTAVKDADAIVTKMRAYMLGGK